MAKPEKQVTVAATRLGKLKKEQARAVRKAGAFLARAEALAVEIEAADHALQDLMAAVRATAVPDGTAPAAPVAPPRRPATGSRPTRPRA